MYNCYYAKDQLLIIKDIATPPCLTTIWIDQQLIVYRQSLEQWTIGRRDYDPGRHTIYMKVELLDRSAEPLWQRIDFYGLGPRLLQRDIPRDFRCGDVLVACDNTFLIPHGYMGHVAIVVDKHSLVEAVADGFCIHHDSIQQFLDQHPNHTHYRPKDVKIGTSAGKWALDYFNKYKENVRRGIFQPIFSFHDTTPLDDPWHIIYCSKLVWLSYHYGANISFENDFGLFAPEDLERCLSGDDRFERLYKHPLYEFKIDL